MFTNDTSSTAPGEGRLIVRHTAAAPAVDVRANGEVAFSNLSNPNEASADLPVGTISADVVPAGGSDVVIGPADLDINDGQLLAVYAVGSLEGESLTVLTETVDGLGTAPAAIQAGTSQVDGGANPGFAVIAGFGAIAALALAAGRWFARANA